MKQDLEPTGRPEPAERTAFCLCLGDYTLRQNESAGLEYGDTTLPRTENDLIDQLGLDVSQQELTRIVSEEVDSLERAQFDLRLRNILKQIYENTIASEYHLFYERYQFYCPCKNDTTLLINIEYNSEQPHSEQLHIVLYIDDLEYHVSQTISGLVSVSDDGMIPMSLSLSAEFEDKFRKTMPPRDELITLQRLENDKLQERIPELNALAKKEIGGFALCPKETVREHFPIEDQPVPLDPLQIKQFSLNLPDTERNGGKKVEFRMFFDEKYNIRKFQLIPIDT